MPQQNRVKSFLNGLHNLTAQCCAKCAALPTPFIMKKDNIIKRDNMKNPCLTRLNKIKNKINTKKILAFFKSEKANAVLEYTIIFPIILLILCTIFVVSFVLHERTTMESAAQRGVVYGARIVADPNYLKLINEAGNNAGSLDLDCNNEFDFTGCGTDIEPYRAFNLSKNDLQVPVSNEVTEMINQTRLGWTPFKDINVTCEKTNVIVYQDVKVTVTAKYPLPKFFEVIGLPAEYQLKTEAMMTVNDPDDFVRNADFAVDIVVKIDEEMFGGRGGELANNIGEKIQEFSDKISGFLKPSED